jgi:hypothetical protein
VTLILFILGLALAFAAARVIFWIVLWAAIQPLRLLSWATAKPRSATAASPGQRHSVPTPGGLTALGEGCRARSRL